jgi:hypothetical protein
VHGGKMSKLGESLAGRMQLKAGSATVSVAPVGVPPTGLELKSPGFLLASSRSADAFGGTPKAAGEDARAPQSICVKRRV